MLIFTPKFGAWVTVALAGLAHAHIGPYHPAMYAINGTDPANPSLYTGISSNPLYNLKYSEYWMHAIYGVLNFPPPAEKALEITPGGTITLELAENAWFTSLSPNPNLTPWGDGKQHPRDYSITNLGGDTISPSGCISSPNLHCQNETMAAGTALAISYESDPSKVTLDNSVIFSVLEHTPFMRIATYQVPLGLPPSNGLVHILWLWIPFHCGQDNMYIFPLLARVLPGPTPAKTIGKPQQAKYCERDQSQCLKGPKQAIIWKQAEGNSPDPEPAIGPNGQWAALGYNYKCGFENGAQNDIFVSPDSPDALFPPPGAGQPVASNTSTSVEIASTASGTPALVASGTLTDPGSNASGKPTVTDPVASTASSFSAAPGTATTTPTQSGTLILSSSSSASATSQGTCKSKHTGSGHKRMMHREKQNIF